MIKYFVISSFPDEGNSVEIYKSEAEAQKAYKDNIPNISEGYLIGVMLIKGEIVKREGALCM